MRIFQYTVVRIVVAAAPICALGVLGGMWIGGLPGVLVQVVGAIALYVGYVRLVERRRVDELAGDRAVPELGGGVALGAALFAATIGVLWVMGVATVERVGDWEGAGRMAVAAIAASILEEILMRAILFRLVERSLGTWIALGVSAALFGAIHAFNQGATLVSTVAIALEAGVLLAATLVLTRRLWLALGTHAAWNFTEGGFFGASVSGGTAHGLLASRFDGPPLWTGGAFGPEASIVAVGICLAAGTAMLVIAYRRGWFVAPRWRRARATPAAA